MLRKICGVFVSVMLALVALAPAELLAQYSCGTCTWNAELSAWEWENGPMWDGGGACVLERDSCWISMPPEGMDTDGDGLFGMADPCPDDYCNLCVADTDGDSLPNDGWDSDIDNDGIPNEDDLDIDGDGRPNSCDVCPNGSSASGFDFGKPGFDDNNDGYLDSCCASGVDSICYWEREFSVEDEEYDPDLAGGEGWNYTVLTLSIRCVGDGALPCPCGGGGGTQVSPLEWTTECADDEGGGGGVLPENGSCCYEAGEYDPLSDDWDGDGIDNDNDDCPLCVAGCLMTWDASETRWIASAGPAVTVGSGSCTCAGCPVSSYGEDRSPPERVSDTLLQRANRYACVEDADWDDDGTTNAYDEDCSIEGCETCGYCNDVDNLFERIKSQLTAKFGFSAISLFFTERLTGEVPEIVVVMPNITGTFPSAISVTPSDYPVNLTAFFTLNTGDPDCESECAGEPGCAASCAEDDTWERNTLLELARTAVYFWVVWMFVPKFVKLLRA